jgi:hypothetical protein
MNHGDQDECTNESARPSKYQEYVEDGAIQDPNDPERAKVTFRRSNMAKFQLENMGETAKERLVRPLLYAITVDPEIQGRNRLESARTALNNA